MQNINSNKHSINAEHEVSQGTAECDLVEHKALQQQVAKLGEVNANLEDAIQIKNSQLNSAHHERGRLLSEVKKQKRCNRNLKQQLDDERHFYQREKDHFTEEMQRYRVRCTGNVFTKLDQQRRKELEQVQDTLETENKQFKEELANKNEVIYNLCIKFLRMKYAKDILRNKLDQLLHEHLLVMAEMMEKLDEARKELNLIVSRKFQEPLPLSKAKFLQVVQRNNRLIYENATLKARVHLLMQKLKSNVQKPKKINVDAAIIEKLSTQSCTRSILSKTEKIALFKKLSQSVDHSEDAEIISRIYSRNTDDRTFGDVKDIEEDLKEFHTERAQSAPGIVDTSTVSQGNRKR
ncbi:PREDICTED: uncharacterized protein LOC106741021 [Dinoponera quadriceps]|uniref:Uncharacterized protein LOC106741021 n=1 Tax=Dinoponera quadriceps TaxID=609295 RepID=A0A6P3WQL3_DINQU|nr:PREDICTED: uncharacterized protein LOC106741021 [Dinoponera quadriceps]